VRERIEVLCAEVSLQAVERQRAQRHLRQAQTAKTKEVLLEARDRRIKALEAENRKLKEDLKVVYGKLYEQL